VGRWLGWRDQCLYHLSPTLLALGPLPIRGIDDRRRRKGMPPWLAAARLRSLGDPWTAGTMGFLIRRLSFYVATAWAAITMNFFIPRLMPGNPVELFLARLRGQGQITPRAIKALTIAFGLHTRSSLVLQYVDYWGQLLHGDLGISITYYPSGVSSVIAAALPWTLALVGTTTAISFLLGTLVGTIAAWRRGSWWDLALPAATCLSAVPYFFVGLLLISIFAVTFGWFPLAGGYGQSVQIGLSWNFVTSAIDHAVLPGVSIIVTSIAGWILGMRNMMVTTLGEDYILVAQAKGLSPRRVMFVYAARNAILPSMAGFALAVSLVVSGSILVEYIFSYPGIGYVLFQAVNNEDYPLMQAIFLIITLAVLVANLCADLLYIMLDPRARQEV
jgi:peptide/nickel transport system permease protein